MSLLPDHRDLTPAELKMALDSGQIALVDVREAYEFDAERIPGSLNYPLSSFDPAALPADGKTVVLSCAGGVRSLRAMGACQLAGLQVDHHLGGGINAWKAAGLPTER